MPVKEEHKKRIALEARPLLSQEVNTYLCCAKQHNYVVWRIAACSYKLDAACRCAWVITPWILFLDTSFSSTQDHGWSFWWLLVL
jgi:hypothetical protein